MKKTLLSLTLALLSASGLSAQDTNCLFHSSTDFNPFMTVTQADYGKNSYDPTKLVDGNTTSNAGWGDNTLNQEGIDIASDPAWMLFDFFTDYHLTGLEIYFNDATRGEFYVEFFDVNNSLLSTIEGQELPSGAGGKALIPIDVDGARYVKLNFTKAYQPGWGIQIKEVCFYGSKTDASGNLAAYKPISEMPNLIYTDGPWAGTITGTDASSSLGNIIDGSEDTQGGWTDGKLGADRDVAPGNYFTIDLKRRCNISAIEVVNANATIQGYNVTFYAENPDVNPAAAPVYTYNYVTETTADKSVEQIYLREEVKGARYVRFEITRLKAPDWGGRIREVRLYGLNNRMLTVDKVVLSTTRLAAGQTSYVKVQGYDEDGELIFDNIDATFNVTGTAFTIGEKTDNGYPFTGVSETAGETLTFTTNIPGVDEQTGSAVIVVGKAISDMTNLIYNDGIWKSEITGYSPEPVQNIQNIIDGDEETQGGWADNKLGNSNDLDPNENYFTIDLKRRCNISALQMVNPDATIMGYIVKFYAVDPDANPNAEPLYSYDYLTTIFGKGTTDIYLPDVVTGARYIKFCLTKLRTYAWGGRFYEVRAFGPDNRVPSVDKLSLSTNMLVVGRTTYVKVQGVTEEGDVLFDNLDAEFTLGNMARLGTNFRIGAKTDEGYPFFGLHESVVESLSFTADIQGVGEKSGSTDIIVASPLNQHVCLLNHTTNETAVAIQARPTDEFNADNAINGVDGSDFFLSGWDATTIAKTENGLDPDRNWWAVDLGFPATVEALRIIWNDNYASRYKIELFDENYDLWEHLRNPAEASEHALYTLEFTYDGTPEAHTDIVRFEQVFEKVNQVRVTMLDAATDNGVQFHEVCLFGRDNEDYIINDLALVRKNVNVGETREYAIYGLTNSGYTVGTIDDAVMEVIEEEVEDYRGRAVIDNSKHTITGVRNGRTPVRITWGDIVTETFLEVTTGDWTNSVNIARSFSSDKVSTPSTNGFTQGNPRAEVYSKGIKGLANERPDGLIDGDWMSWTITADEMDEEVNPYVVIDLGYSFLINEFNIHWNADAGSENQEGSYIMLSGNYKVYGSNDNNEWKEIYTVANRSQRTYVPDRHTFQAENFRYLKFEFTSPKTYGQNVSINEITVGGPQFLNAQGNLIDYPDTRMLSVVTPTFDCSNQANRSIDNDWIVTSTDLNQNNPLKLSYLGVDCYGREFVDNDDNVRLYILDENNELGTEIVTNGKTVHYREITWPCYIYDPDKVGAESVRAVASLPDGSEIVSKDFTIYTFSDRGNVNRYAYAYDNAVDYDENWEVDGKPGIGDRDLSFLGTAPQNASDGSYGSWYAVGYYGPGDHMGQTYKYPANTTLERPYELIMDYRGEDYDAEGATASRYVKELDMIGLQFEGAYARDYNVHLLFCDEDGNVMKNEDGTDKWEEVASFVGLRWMGVGQVETQRIYPADENGFPLLDEEGRVIPWKNVAAVKVELVTLGTQWGLKIMESAIYGVLNKTVLQLGMQQGVYADREASEAGNAYYSFDLDVKTDFSESDYVSSELESLANELPKVQSYRVSLEMEKLQGGRYVNDSFTETTRPAGVMVGGQEITGEIDADGFYVFDVPVAAPDADDLRSMMVPELLVKHVDPSRNYRATAVALNADGDVVAEVEINQTDLEQLVMPATTFAPAALTVSAVDGEIADYDTLIHASEGRQAAAIGSTADAHKAPYHKVNKASVNGAFAALAVTDDVIANWDIAYETSVTVNDRTNTYTTTFERGTGLNHTTEAQIDYVPVMTSNVTAGEALAEQLAEAPEDVKGQMLITPDAQSELKVTSTNAVTYIRADKSATVKATAVTASVAQTALNDVVLPVDGIASDAKPEYVADDDCSRWDAYVNHTFSVPTPELNNFVGFYASNNVHALLDAHHGAANGFFKGGVPMATTPAVTPEENEPAAAAAINNDTDNFGWVAARDGVLTLRLHHMATEPADFRGDLDDVYSLVTNEYPLILAPVDENGVVSETVAPRLNIAGGVTELKAAPAAREAEANIQSVMAAAAVKTPVNVSTLTGIDSVSVAVGSLAVYPNPADDVVSVSASSALGEIGVFTLDGRLVKQAESSETKATINVGDLTSGLYIVRAAGASARLIKR
nr:T9SS type A sorting domain-containing protein [Bacteroides sp.]